MIEQTSVTDAYRKWFKLTIQVANHLGHIPTDQPDYTPFRDPDVQTFIEQAIFNEIQAESQQVHELDALDREV